MPLFWAADYGREAVLLEKGAGLETKHNYFAQMPLLLATIKRYEGVVVRCRV